MTFRPPMGAPQMPHLDRRGRWVLRVIVGVIAAIVLINVYIGVQTNLWWYRSVGFSRVYTTRLLTETVLFVGAGLIMAAVVYLNIYIARRTRPPFTGEGAIGVDRQLRVLGTVATTIAVLAIGGWASSQWQTVLLWKNAVAFGIKDLQFGKDISFFMFVYPFYRALVQFGFALALASLIVAAAAHYVFGALRVLPPAPGQAPRLRVSPAARAHLSVVFGVLMLLKAAAYFLDRYGLAFSPRGIVTGPSYTDVHAVLPAKTILVIVAVICAGLFFANLVSRGWLLPISGMALLVLSAVVIGGIYPYVVETFEVKPSQLSKEKPYIARMIATTNQAYGLTGAKGVDYVATTGTTTAVQALSAGSTTIANIRLLDPQVLQNTFQQLQGIKNFYDFPDTLSIDRYTIDGKSQEMVLAVRDVAIANLTSGQSNWINDHLVYTHGYGLVAAASNKVDGQGNPVFTESGIPAAGVLGLTQEGSRVYFGLTSPDYSIVGAPAGTPPRELDYPTSSASGQAQTTYTGNGGVPVGSTFSRLIYALKFKDINILLSNLINSDSQILYTRTPQQRVQAVAPYLTLDSDPYPAVVNGHIVWIVDGYTTSDRYPYSQQTNLQDATTNSTTAASTQVLPQQSVNVNYMRNSVKAVVDAYTGKVTLYQWGASDPILQTWEKIFPGTVQPQSAIPADLLGHLRYPEDLFSVQRQIIARYHVTNPSDFYNGTDFWKIPADPTVPAVDGSLTQPPYYLTLSGTAKGTSQFALTTSFDANARQNLAAFMQVNSDPASAGYGQITVLQLPGDTQVAGPAQVFNQFESFPQASQLLTLLRQGGSQTVEGNLLTLPVGQGLLYVEPIYVKSTGSSSYPILKEVFADYNGTPGFASTLPAALEQAFGVSAPTTTGGGPGNGSGAGAPSTLAQAVADLNNTYAQAQAYLKAGNLVAYAREQEKVAQAITNLDTVLAKQHLVTGTSSGSTPTTTPTASPSATPAG